ncbi:MAG: hypothetical protein Kow00109_18370 [Acidobacteriota bacterium]
MRTVEQLKDRVRGVLLGLAAGDRIGGPTRMALLVAESLLDGPGFDPADLGRRYLDWWCREGFDTGPTAAAVFQSVAAGASYETAAADVERKLHGRTAGCNPAHRSAPLAMSVRIPDADLPAAAAREAALTHRHPLAGDVAAAVVVLCRRLIRGTPWSLAQQEAAAGRLPETRRALELSQRRLSPGGFAPEALAAAVHFVGSSATLREALERSVSFAGPANYCPVLVGSIGGARWGAGAVPETFLEHHHAMLPRLRHVAASLAAQWPASAREGSDS